MESTIDDKMLFIYYYYWFFLLLFLFFENFGDILSWQVGENVGSFAVWFNTFTVYKLYMSLPHHKVA